MLSDSGGSTVSESPSESLEPFMGVGTMLTRFCGIVLLPFCRGEIGLLLTEWSSSESTSAILKRFAGFWPR